MKAGEGGGKERRREEEGRRRGGLAGSVASVCHHYNGKVHNRESLAIKTERVVSRPLSGRWAGMKEGGGGRGGEWGWKGALWVKRENGGFCG